jgi:hypothetical protein
MGLLSHHDLYAHVNVFRAFTKHLLNEQTILNLGVRAMVKL